MHATPSHRAPATPTLETLEPRWLLSGTHFIVSSLADTVAVDGAVTLREALTAANTNAPSADAPAGSAAEADTITFDLPALQAQAGAGNPLRIVLAGTELTVSDDVDILGPGAAVLTIDADARSRVLRITGAETDATLSGLTITGGKVVGSGGGIVNDGHMVIINTLVTDNEADGGDGGGIISSGSLTLTNVTVSGNRCSLRGGGVARSGSVLSPDSLRIHNSIVALNHGNTDDPDLLGGFVGSRNLIGIDPGFADAANGVYELAPTSIAINRGDNALATAPDGSPLTQDLLGHPRVADGVVDLGAYEFQGAPGGQRELVSTTVTTLDDVVNAVDGRISLREALAHAMLGDVGSTVTFSPALSGGRAELGQRELLLHTSVAIDGSAADNIVIDAGRQHRVLHVTGPETNVDLVGLTVTGGRDLSKGGGIHHQGRRLILANVVVAGNEVHGTPSSGGGIYNESGTLVLTNVTVSGNMALDGFSSGGGICNDAGVLVLQNSIVALNAAMNGGDICGEFGVRSSLVGIDPGFVDPLGGNFRLGPTSVAIDRGDDALAVAPNGVPLAVDVSGSPRVVGSAVDLGAYERQGAPAPEREAPSPVVTTLEDVVDPTDGQTSLREALLHAALGGFGSAVTFAPLLAGGQVTLGGDELLISGEVTVEGPAAGIVIDADGASRAIMVDSLAHVALANLTVTGGHVSGNGGGIHNRGILTLSHVDVIGNATSASGLYQREASGGGIYSTGTLALADCRVADNSALNEAVLPEVTRGGGIRSDGGVLTLERVLISGNSLYCSMAQSTVWGAGVDCSLGTTTILDSTVSGNTGVAGSLAVGGGVLSAGGSFTMSGSTVCGNTLAAAGSIVWGGGIAFLGGDSTLADVTVSGNSVTARSAAGGGVYAGGGTVRMTNVRIERNQAEGRDAGGGGLAVNSAAVTLTDVMVSQNTATASGLCLAEGGGIDNHGGSLLLSRVVISGNAAVGASASSQASGGGLRNESGSITLLDTSIAGNTASGAYAYGGGIYNEYGSLDMVNVQVRQNEAPASVDSYGGALYNLGGAVSLTNVAICGNSADAGSYARGGAIYTSSGPLTATNTVISGNRGSASFALGGAVFNQASTELTNVTVSGNVASGALVVGGGLYSYEGVLTLHNTISALNVAAIGPDVFGTVTGAHNLIGVDPGFVRNPSPGPDGQWGTEDDDYGDLRLRPTGPAVEAGDTALLPADAFDLDGDGDVTEPLPVDLAGNPRVYGASVDIGAYEARYATVTGRHLFYNGSAFDGFDPAANAADDAAIDATRQALRPGQAFVPGQPAVGRPVSGYARGLNGVMVDVLHAAGTLAAGDLAFRVGGLPGGDGWRAAPQPVSVTVRPGAGVGGADRVTIVFADGAIQDAWLEVTLRATAATGLRADEVFWFGHLGGDADGDGIVGLADLAAVATHWGGAGAPDEGDFSGDGVVGLEDLALLATNWNRALAAPVVATGPTAVSVAATTVAARRAEPARREAPRAAAAPAPTASPSSAPASAAPARPAARRADRGLDAPLVDLLAG